MTQVQFLNWTFLVDKELTRSIYQTVDKGGASECACSMCKNYISNRRDLFPALILQLFDDLSIDIDKEYEVYHMTKKGDGLHLYGTWFDFAGEIIAEFSFEHFE